MNNFDTIREALRLLLPDYPETAITAIDALAAIEADHFSAADMASAAAQGHRDGVASVTQGEPFGYFRPEPFGWTDCAETDEGAIALYAAAPVAQQPQAEAVPHCEAGPDHCPQCEAEAVPSDVRAEFEKARAGGAFSPALDCCPTWYATELRFEGWSAAIAAQGAKT